MRQLKTLHFCSLALQDTITLVMVTLSGTRVSSRNPTATKSVNYKEFSFTLQPWDDTLCHRKNTHSRTIMNILSDDNYWRELRVHYITIVHLTCRFYEVCHQKGETVCALIDSCSRIVHSTFLLLHLDLCRKPPANNHWLLRLLTETMSTRLPPEWWCSKWLSQS